MKGIKLGVLLFVTAIGSASALWATPPTPRSIFLKCETSSQVSAIKVALERKIAYEVASATPSDAPDNTNVNLSGLKVTVNLTKLENARPLEIPYANMDRLHGGIASGGFNGPAPTLDMGSTEVNGAQVIANDCSVRHRLSIKVSLPVFDLATKRYIRREAYIGTLENPRYINVPGFRRP